MHTMGGDNNLMLILFLLIFMQGGNFGGDNMMLILILLFLMQSGSYMSRPEYK